MEAMITPDTAGAAGVLELSQLPLRTPRAAAVPAPVPAWAAPYRVAKRALDVIVALAALVLLAPVMLAVMVAVRLDSPGPVLFRQRRCGWGERDFDMLKFRSMVDGADNLVIDLRDQNEADGLLFKIREDPRITRVGRFIRRTSLDELPQLINVLRGDMSLVGPRPLPVAKEQFDDQARMRHAVRPGVTGYWQVSGRTGVGYREMIELDLRYINEASLARDLSVLVRTVPAVLSSRNAY